MSIPSRRPRQLENPRSPPTTRRLPNSREQPALQPRSPMAPGRRLKGRGEPRVDGEDYLAVDANVMLFRVNGLRRASSSPTQVAHSPSILRIVPGYVTTNPTWPTSSSDVRLTKSLADRVVMSLLPAGRSRVSGGLGLEPRPSQG